MSRLFKRKLTMQHLRELYDEKFGKFNAWRNVGNPKLEKHFGPDDFWEWINKYFEPKK